MTQTELTQKFDECADALDEYLQTSSGTARIVTQDSALHDAVQKLSKGLYVLLPPRGPTATLDCPHCSNPVKVSLSK